MDYDSFQRENLNTSRTNDFHSSKFYESVISSSDVAESLARNENEENDPSNPESFIKLGKEEELKKHRDEALQIYDKGITLCPNFIELYKLKSLCLCNLGRFNDAMAFINEKIDKKFNIADMMCIKGHCYYKNNNKIKALEITDKVLKIKKNHQESLFLKAQCLYDLGDNKSALKILDIIIKHNPTSSQGLFLKGIILEQDKKYNEAIESYSQSLNSLNGKGDQKNEVYFCLGRCYQHLENYKKAIFYYESLSKFESKGEVYYNLGYCYFEIKQYNRAINNFDLCLVLSYENEKVLHYKALSYISLNNEEKAFRCYKNLIEINANNLESYCYIAKYYIRQNQIADANSYIQLANTVIELATYREEDAQYSIQIKNLENEIKNLIENKKCQCAACLIF